MQIWSKLDQKYMLSESEGIKIVFMGATFWTFNPLQTEWAPPHYILEESNFNFR